MLNFKWSYVAWLLLPLMYYHACAPSPQQEDASRSSTSSPIAAVESVDSVAVREFVQRFYDWYTPIAIGSPSFVASWTSTATYLHPAIAAALQGDSVARQDNQPSRETLNFDPFLDSQDPCPRYEVVDVKVVGDTFRVSVRPICPNATWQSWQTKTPIVEVVPQGDQWKIANVWYDSGLDLRGLLCKFAKADQLPERRDPDYCR